MDALDDLSDAIDLTRDLLTPVEAGLWLKLAIVVFFVGGVGFGGPPMPTGDVEPVTDGQPVVTDGDLGEIPQDVLVIAAALIVVGILLLVLYSIVAAIMEFVFIESLRSGTVHMRRYVRANLGRGIRLFLFRLVVNLAVLLLVGVPAVLTVLGAASFDAALGTLLLIGLLAIPVYLVYAIVMRFTSEFVAPVMLLEGRSVLGAWRRFGSTLTANRTEFVVYLLLVWLLRLMIGIAAGIVIVAGLLAIAVPFVLLVFGALMLGPIGPYLAAVVGAAGILVALLYVSLVRVPIRSYFQYYALLLLGDTDPDLDLIPDRRAVVRAGGVRPGSGTAGRGPNGRDGADGRSTDDERSWDTDSSDLDDSDRWDESESDDRDDDRGW